MEESLNHKMDFFLCDDENEKEMFDSSDDDNDNINNVCKIVGMVLRNKRLINHYYEEVVPSYSEQQFSTHFRINKTLFQSLAQSFSSSELFKSLSKYPSSRYITADKHIAVFLWYAGHQSSYRDVANRFGLSLSSLFDILSRVATYLNDMAEDVIQMPTTEAKQQTIDYYSNKGFPNVIGCLAGCHIQIDRPKERSTDYYNQKNFYSVVLQALCDHNLKFLDVMIGYPGSVHNAKVFRNSNLFTELDELCSDKFILANNAYPLSRNVMTPYRDNGHLTHAQKYFNRRLNSCTVCIKHAFDRLKQRFKQLYHVKLMGQTRICLFIHACCVLHNLAIDDNFSFERLTEEDPVEHFLDGDNDKEGTFIRDEICRQIYP